MNLVPCDDPILLQPCEKYDFLNPQVNLVEFADDLVRTMYKSNGIGLSANQVGVPIQIFVMAAEKPLLIINPQIVEYSKETIELEEGCLSFPGDLVKVRRSVWINARYRGPDGKANTYRFEGITARVFQHEYDHIVNGKTMFDNISKLKKEMYLKKKMKRMKK
jgi:peptide deformylase